MALSLPVVPVDALLPRLPGWRRYKWLWAVAIVFLGRIGFSTGRSPCYSLASILIISNFLWELSSEH